MFKICGINEFNIWVIFGDHKSSTDTVYSVVTVNDFEKDATNTRKVLILRHDLDKNIKLVEILKSTALKN